MFNKTTQKRTLYTRSKNYYVSNAIGRLYLQVQMR